MLGIIGLGIMHEQVHVAINNSYGIDSEVKYFEYFPNFVTVADKPCPTDECVLAHNINEVVGYPLTIFYMVLMSGLLILIVNTEDRL